MRFLECKTPDELLVAQALRYEVFCLEKGWVDPSSCPEGIETDEDDGRAVHFLALEGDEAVGTVRCLLASRQVLPAAHHLDLASLGRDERAMLEVSRLATRRTGRSRDLRVFLGLNHLIWGLAQREGIDTWLAIADVPLFHLFQRLGLPLLLVGETTHYLGSPCVPIALDVDATAQVLFGRRIPLPQVPAPEPELLLPE